MGNFLRKEEPAPFPDYEQGGFRSGNDQGGWQPHAAGDGQGSGQSPFPAQGSGQSPFPAQGSGQSPFPAQGSGQSPFPAQGSGQSPFPAQGSGQSPFPAQGSGQSPFPTKGSGAQPSPFGQGVAQISAIQAPPATSQAVEDGPPIGHPTTSTAPTNSAAPIIDGLPVSWPIPTAQQNAQWVTNSTLEKNKAIQGQRAPINANPWDPADIEFAREILESQNIALSIQTKREQDDMREKLDQLYSKLQDGLLNPAGSAKLKEFCHAIQNEDYTTALKLQRELAGVHWNDHKNWLLGIKRLASSRAPTSAA